MRTKPVSVQLREAIDRSEHTRYRISKETCITQSTLSRFATGKASLSLDAVDALAVFLGLELTPRKPAKRAAATKGGR
jgi:hypothetical protein